MRLILTLKHNGAERERSKILFRKQANDFCSLIREKERKKIGVICTNIVYTYYMYIKNWLDDEILYFSGNN